MSLRAIGLVALLLLPACSGAAGPAAAPSPASPAAAVPTPSTPPGTGSAADGATPPAGGPRVLVAVVRPVGPLQLREVDPATYESAPVRTLEPPTAGAQVVDVALADGAEPLVCASWHLTAGQVYDDLETTLQCYPWGSEQGVDVTGVERPRDVALSSDGTRIAWSLATTGEQNPVFSTAELDDGQVVDVERRRGRAAAPDDSFTGTDVQDLAWADDRHLVVSTAAQSDDDPQLFVVDLDEGQGGGWLEDAAVVPAPTSPPGYRTFDSVRSAGATTALADQRGDDMSSEDEQVPDRAVRIDLETGRVLETVATVASGRALVGVSGSADAVVYVTGVPGGDVVDDAKAYLRLRGEPRGRPISGLPADVQDVLAQS